MPIFVKWDIRFPEMYGYVYDGVYQYEDFNEISPNVSY